MAKNDTMGGLGALLSQMKEGEVASAVEKLKAFTATEQGKELVEKLLSALKTEGGHG